MDMCIASWKASFLQKLRYNLPENFREISNLFGRVSIGAVSSCNKIETRAYFVHFPHRFTAFHGGNRNSFRLKAELAEVMHNGQHD